MSKYYKIPMKNGKGDMDNNSYMNSINGYILSDNTARIDEFPDNFDSPKESWTELTEEEYLSYFPPVVETEIPPETKKVSTKDLLLVTMNNLATIYPDKVDSDLLGILVQEGKQTIADIPSDKINAVKNKLGIV